MPGMVYCSYFVCGRVEYEAKAGRTDTSGEQAAQCCLHSFHSEVLVITYIVGNIFSSKCQALVNPVNCVGDMGAGLAVKFANRMPADYFHAYNAACASGKLDIGSPTIWRTMTLPPGFTRGYAPPEVYQKWFVVNFPTKRHWADPSYLTYIDMGLERICRKDASGKSALERAGITSIAFPKLGCGLGGLSWDEVGPLMAMHLDPIPVTVEIYLGSGDREYFASGTGQISTATQEYRSVVQFEARRFNEARLRAS